MNALFVQSSNLSPLGAEEIIAIRGGQGGTTATVSVTSASLSTSTSSTIKLPCISCSPFLKGAVGNTVEVKK
jgi:hypothetical protein